MWVYQQEKEYKEKVIQKLFPYMKSPEKVEDYEGREVLEGKVCMKENRNQKLFLASLTRGE